MCHDMVSNMQSIFVKEGSLLFAKLSAQLMRDCNQDRRRAVRPDES